MGLKDLQSTLDLVQGTNPVGNMDEQQGPQFDFGIDSTLQIDSLDIVPGGVYNGIQLGNSPFQDLNGQQGPQFNLGEDSIFQQNSLENIYNSLVNPNASYGAGQPGSTYPSVNPSSLDLGGVPGTQFNQGPEPVGPNQIDTIQETGLEGLYNSIVNPDASYGAGQPNGAWPVVAPSTLDLNGQQGPQFDNGPEPTGPNQIDTFHESALVNMYNSIVNPEASYGAGQPGSNYPNINATTLDLNGEQGPGFSVFYNGGIDIHEASLTSTYPSTVNPNASYGAGQPGGSWPNVFNATLDLDGGLPNNGQYINNLPD